MASENQELISPELQNKDELITWRTVYMAALQAGQTSSVTENGEALVLVGELPHVIADKAVIQQRERVARGQQGRGYQNYYEVGPGKLICVVTPQPFTSDQSAALDRLLSSFFAEPPGPG